MNIIEQMLVKYKVTNNEEYFSAIREVMQEIALAGLYRGNFYSKAAFYGGTALRIFYGLDRFSEDMDFSLLEANEKFSLNPFLPYLKNEFSSLGIAVDLSIKEKTQDSNIESAFLKTNTSIYQIGIEFNGLEKINIDRQVKIKLEVDKTPPLKFNTEDKLLLQPFSFYAKCFTLSSLFAGKMHALLFRSWKNRVKGRDWYDFEWYVRNRVPLNLVHFKERALQSGHLTDITRFEKHNLEELIHNKIDSLNIELAKNDIVKFIKDDRKIDIWSRDYFHHLVDMLNVSS
ncbi:MAG: nucleotidyl transferase AbiEii/AbiGii toxin family protein [Candidatus Riflemargulisbacteria bacterium]